MNLKRLVVLILLLLGASTLALAGTATVNMGVAYTGTGSGTSVTYQGRTPAGQTALPSELYTDTAVVTITF